MSKTRIAAVLTGAFAAPAVLADTTLYGFVAAGIEYVQAPGGPDADTRIDLPDRQPYRGRMRIRNENSRIGFKGAEDLGDDLKVAWQVEQGLAIDGRGATSGWATRNTFIGLQGDFGELRLGRHDDTYKLLGGSAGLNVMGNTTADNSWGRRTIFGRGGARRSNAAIYLSPRIAGTRFAAHYSAGENRRFKGKRHIDADIYGAGINYAGNGLSAVVAHNRTRDRKDFGNALPQSLPPAPGLKRNAYLAAIRFRAGSAMLGAGYERLKAGQQSQAGWTVAGEYRFDALSLKASYSGLGKRSGTGNGNAHKARQWVLGASYDLSKHTQVLAYATRIDNGKAAAANFGVNGIADLKPGADPQACGAALKHAF